jgi:hypothetical protein
MLRLLSIAMVVAALAAPEVAVARERNGVAVTLSGSRASMLRQNRIAKEEQYSFLRTPTQVRTYVDRGRLVAFEGNADYAVIASYPYARPVVLAFVERLSARYREACGERLVVTSLTRPATRQPSNASPLSVHPAGMAVDLRVSGKPACREWLMAELLDLEDMGLLDATLERNPPHFHVAVFPSAFDGYEQELAAAAVEAELESLRELEEAIARADYVAALPAPVVAATAPAPRPVGVIAIVATLVARLFLPFSV